MSGVRIQITYKAGNLWRVLRLPRTLEYEQDGEVVGYDNMMLSGKIVTDIVGYRPIFIAKWDYFPADILGTVLKLVRRGEFYDVVLETDGGASSASSKYKIEQVGSMKFFKYSNPRTEEGAIWHGLTLKFLAQEVQRP